MADNGSQVSTATVTRRNLTAQQQVDGALGYGDSYTVLGRPSGSSAGGSPNHAGGSTGASPGTLTWVADVGQVIKQGQAVYEVDAVPVELLYGATPAYRDLPEGATGKDVTELNADLVALGYAGRSQIDPTSDSFGAATVRAVKKFQDHLGVDQDGVLHLGQVVFLPTPLRVTAIPETAGGQATGPIVQGTSTTRRVVVNLDATQQLEIKEGDKVAITLPNGQPTPGTVTNVGTVASKGSGASGSGSASGSGASSGSGSGSGSGATPTVEVDIAPSDPSATGNFDQGPVQVQIVTATASDALVVPVTALLSLAGGGYAVEVIGPDGTHQLVGVSLGLFDDADGLVQVTDTRVQPGQKILVAGA
jgi:hypothetical protein